MSPWPAPADWNWSEAVMDAIDENTGVVALPHCHWTDGGLLDLQRIGARAAAQRAPPSSSTSPSRAVRSRSTLPR